MDFFRFYLVVCFRTPGFSPSRFPTTFSTPPLLENCVALAGADFPRGVPLFCWVRSLFFLYLVGVSRVLFDDPSVYREKPTGGGIFSIILARCLVPLVHKRGKRIVLRKSTQAGVFVPLITFPLSGDVFPPRLTGAR